MGCFDTFYDKCPNCGIDDFTQTKLGPCLLRDIKPGEPAECFEENIRFRAKEPCVCGFYPIVVIENGKFIGFQSGGADHAEERFGKITELQNRR